MTRTSRLLPVIEWLRLDGAGGLKSGDVPVFSNDVGKPLKTFTKAWVVAVLKAHGVEAHWRKGSYKDLTPECQVRFREINLHWHDLRHEYASRLVERGVPLAQVRDLLGHASISQPSATTTGGSRHCRLRFCGLNRKGLRLDAKVPRTTFQEFSRSREREPCCRLQRSHQNPDK